VRQLLLYNARVLTIDPARPLAEAVLVEGERIAWVGSSREAFSRASPEARRLDLEGRCLIPGFNDNHIHALSLGDSLSRLSLAGLDCERIVECLRQRYAGARPGEVLLAYSWDYPHCPNPHRRLLDAAFPRNPVVLFQYSGHAAWVNGFMLRRLGIGAGTPDPRGGQIVRDADGEPTGVLRDVAIPKLHDIRLRQLMSSPVLRRRLMARSLELLRRAGVTSVQDNTWNATTVWTLNELRRRGELTCRFSCWTHGMRPWLARSMLLARYDRQWVRRGPWKYFLDGTFSTRTAWLLEPYRDEPANQGRAAMTAEGLDAVLRRSAGLRRQAAFHAIGDRAIRGLADAVEAARARYPILDSLRLRIEHGQLIDPADIPRLARLGILVAAQPTALGEPAKDEALLGPERARRAYPYRSLLDAGVHLSFGSDVPGEARYEPLLAIHWAVNRPSPERISPLEALTCYTLGSAYAEFQEGEKGSISPGKLADLAALSADPTAVPPERIRELKVDLTIVGGRVVFERGLLPYGANREIMHRSGTFRPRQIV
jgi:predicted amidohydrolase YtcJ